MIKVANCQRGNAVLEYLNAAVWGYSQDVTADYEINRSTSVLFLSLKFHACKPEYIYKRINRLNKTALNILLVLIDVPNYNLSLRALYNTTPLTIITCCSNEECSLYLRGLEMAKCRTVDVLRRRVSGHASFMESFPNINKTDSKKILSSIESFQDLFAMSEEQLADIPGIGKVKAVGIKEYLKMPFRGASSHKQDGQTICAPEGFIRGHGTLLVDNSVKSTYFGKVRQINKLITVSPVYSYKYTPEIGDVVIGRITQISNKKWKVDTNSKIETTLSLSAINLPGVMQRRKSETDEMNMRQFFDINDLVVCEVQKVSKSGNAALHTRNEKYRKLENGVLVEVPGFLVMPTRSRFITAGSIELIVGCNGFIWITTGSEEAADLRKVGMLYTTIKVAAANKIKINVDLLVAEVQSWQDGSNCYLL